MEPPPRLPHGHTRLHLLGQLHQLLPPLPHPLVLLPTAHRVLRQVRASNAEPQLPLFAKQPLLLETKDALPDADGLLNNDGRRVPRLRVQPVHSTRVDPLHKKTDGGEPPLQVVQERRVAVQRPLVDDDPLYRVGA